MQTLYPTLPSPHGYVTTPSVSSLFPTLLLWLTPHSSHTSFLFVPQPLNLAAALRPYTCCPPRISSSALSQKSVLSFNTSSPDHYLPPPACIPSGNILSPYTALYFVVLTGVLEITSLICLRQLFSVSSTRI